MLVGDDGRIVAVGPASTVAARPDAAAAIRHDLGRHALLPGCINSHTHSFQVLLRGNGDNARDFRDWVDGHLYPLVERLDESALVAAALLAYAEMALSGTTTVGEFFYVHHGRGGTGGGNAHASAVVDAGRRLGLRVALLRTMYDLGSKPGQSRFRESVAEAAANTRALHAMYAGDPAVVVRPAPHSLHGASEAMLRAAAEIADEIGAPFHIHLAEQEGDLPFSLERYGSSPLRALDRIGALTERTALVHGIWLDEGERELLAERGGVLVYNPLTNMALGDGVAKIPDLVARGVPIALGTDANNRLNLFDEMRAVEYLQRVTSLEMGIVTGASPDSRGSALPLFEMGTANGASRARRRGRVYCSWDVGGSRRHHARRSVALAGGVFRGRRSAQRRGLLDGGADGGPPQLGRGTSARPRRPAREHDPRRDSRRGLGGGAGRVAKIGTGLVRFRKAP